MTHIAELTAVTLSPEQIETVNYGVSVCPFSTACRVYEGAGR
jgi:hypothetical protein